MSLLPFAFSEVSTKVGFHDANAGNKLPRSFEVVSLEHAEPWRGIVQFFHRIEVCQWQVR